MYISYVITNEADFAFFLIDFVAIFCLFLCYSFLDEIKFQSFVQYLFYILPKKMFHKLWKFFFISSTMLFFFEISKYL